MFVEKTTSRALFCVFMGDWRELEWIMPLLSIYKKTDREFQVLLPCKPSTNRHEIMYRWLKTYTDNIVYSNSIYKNIDLKSILFLSPIFKIINIFHSKFKKPFNFIYSISNAWLIKLFLKNVDLIYVPETWLFGTIPTNNFFGCLVRAGNQSNKHFVGYVFSSFVPNDKDLERLISSKNKKCDSIHMLISKNLKKFYINKNIPSVVAGPQRFYEGWADEIKITFNSNFVFKIPKNKKLALVILKNRSGPSSKLISEEMRSKYKKILLRELIKKEFYLIIKPHPGENYKLLMEDLDGLDKNSYMISEFPSLLLAIICDVGIFEFPSNSIMDLLAAKKPSFFPLEKVIKNFLNISEKKVIQKLIELGSPKYFFDLVHRGIPIPSNLMKPINTDERFNYNINLESVIIKIEKHIMINQKNII